MRKRPLSVGIVFLIIGAASGITFWPELHLIQWLLPLVSGMVSGAGFSRAWQNRNDGLGRPSRSTG